MNKETILTQLVAAQEWIEAMAGASERDAAHIQLMLEAIDEARLIVLKRRMK